MPTWAFFAADSKMGLPGMAAALPSAQTAEEGIGLETLIPAAMLLVAAVLIMNSFIRRQKKAAQQPQMPTGSRERAEAIQAAHRGRDQLQAVVAEAEQLAQRLAAHVDTKAVMLEKLIADADDRLARLERATASQHAPAPNDPPRVETRRPEPARAPVRDPIAPAAGELDPIKRKIYQLADEGKSSVEIAQATDQPTGQVELILALRSA